MISTAIAAIACAVLIGAGLLYPLRAVSGLVTALNEAADRAKRR